MPIRGHTALAGCTFGPTSLNPEHDIPYEVIDLVVDRYALDEQYNGQPQTIVDFMAGKGNTLSRLAHWRIKCQGIELDPILSEAARRNVPDSIIVTGDCRTSFTPAMLGVNYNVWVSPPFTEVEELAAQASPDLWLAQTLHRIVPPGRQAFIDSARVATRDGRTLHPLDDAINYFANPNRGITGSLFSVVGKHCFEIQDPPEGHDSDVAILVLEPTFSAASLGAAMSAYQSRPTYFDV